VDPSGRVRIAAPLVTEAWSLVLLVAGVQLPSTFSKILTSLPTALVVLLAIFDNWMWNADPLKSLVKRPGMCQRPIACRRWWPGKSLRSSVTFGWV
jgi:hypothetical protein